MKKNIQKKVIILSVLAICVGVSTSYIKLPYTSFAQEAKEGATPTPGSLEVASSGALSGNASEFLGALTAIKNIRIDTNLFATDSFRSLNEYTVPIISENNNGRPNPFASVGEDKGVFPVFTTKDQNQGSLEASIVGQEQDQSQDTVLEQQQLQSQIDTNVPNYVPEGASNALNGLSVSQNLNTQKAPSKVVPKKKR